ncbi:MAG: tetratricopeptide repeat protein [Candidatus Sungbacteria bacterium]|uniref:Tetratricopeptide repeat protein n=1 Tax=Candidatus Sungiibacteriota bacterium TaxID=2750080 RepID=A0A931WPD8_9BACT|nr:tetratricopeptide repeat protein [Candidatus Sungbacteria bacterium]
MGENLGRWKRALVRPWVLIGIGMALLLLASLLFRAQVRPLIGLPASERIGIATGQPLPKYAGRDVREIREDPQEVRLFNDEQKKVIRQGILDAAGSIDVDPDVLDPWLKLGLYKKVIGDYEGARDAWEYAGLVRPRNVISFKNLGELYWHYLPDFERAEKNLRVAIENEPQLVDAYITLSDIYHYSYHEKADLADDVLLEGLENNPGSLDLTSYLARRYKEMGNIAKAIEYYEKLLELDPGNSGALGELERLRVK